MNFELTEDQLALREAARKFARSEMQEIAREMDRQKKMELTGFKGAFHEKKPRTKKVPYSPNPKAREIRPYRNTRKG